MKLKNHYFLLRHGESPINLRDLASSWPEKVYSPLTKKGRKKITEVAKLFRNKKIDFIFSSDMLRTKLTAQIIAKGLRLSPRFDKRLRDIDVGIFNGKRISEAGKFWAPQGKKVSSLKYYQRRFTIAAPQGENYVDVEKRMTSFLKDLEKKYHGENILIVGHKRPISLLEKMVLGWSREKFIEQIIRDKEIKNGEIRRL